MPRSGNARPSSRPASSRTSAGSTSAISKSFASFLLLVGWAKTYFSENYVEYWPYFIGVLFVIVVMFLRGGVVEAWTRFWIWRSSKQRA